jgi:ADP-ribosylglycohydrolase
VNLIFMQTIIDRPANLTPSQDSARVMGCWLGKAVGGTLGMPFEGVDGPLDLEFYEPVPTEMLPNDDLDLQVVWACALDKMEEPHVDRHELAKAWQEHVQFPWDEYGVALRNLANGLHPPLSGSYDNWFSHGMGAPIRSEIWACLAPGNPQLAAAYAYEDACVDHAGEGIYGETFFAALESMAFVESDPDVLLDGALATLPADSLVRHAVEDTRRWWQDKRDWRGVRKLILRDYGHENFTDVTMNVAFTVLGWLAGEGDFSRAICIATNCGKDTDCTAATVGALMGIIDPECIPQKWLTPIGRDLVLSPGIVGIDPPTTLDGFTELVIRLRSRLDGSLPQSEAFEQNVEELKIAAAIAFMREIPVSIPTVPMGKSITLAGTMTQWPEADFEDEFLLISYPFYLEQSQTVIAMFNTPQSCRVWVDGTYQFERENGVMVSSCTSTPKSEHSFESRLPHLNCCYTSPPQRRQCSMGGRYW